MDLSILIISFNTRELTLACLRSVFDHAVDAEIEVILWDNASSDGSADAVAEAFPQVRLVRCEENLGFGIANNRAAELATGDRLLLLNSDTEVDPGTLDRLLAFAEAHPQAGVIGGRTFFGDRTLNPTSVYGRPSLRAVACKGLGLSVIGRRSKWLNPESLGGWARDTARPVDIITGCFLMMRKPDWDQLGGFD
ncbi:MAG: glycosyltransferase family 2 protein, partial [Planctomycetota bacterium]